VGYVRSALVVAFALALAACAGKKKPAQAPSNTGSAAPSEEKAPPADSDADSKPDTANKKPKRGDGRTESDPCAGGQ
jgi:hypothetical protein